VEIEKTEDCPNYAGRVMIRLDSRAHAGLDAREAAPLGCRSIHPVVDVTNYVSWSWVSRCTPSTWRGSAVQFRVRRARAGSRCACHNQLVHSARRILLITDDSGPLALAGVMGGAGVGSDRRHDHGVLEVPASPERGRRRGSALQAHRRRLPLRARCGSAIQRQALVAPRSCCWRSAAARPDRHARRRAEAAAIRVHFFAGC